MVLDIRYRVEYALLAVLVALIRLLPMPVAAEISARAWRSIAPRTRRHRRALKNLEKAMPQTTAGEREAIARGMWDNLGRTMAEGFHLPRLMREAWRVEYEDPALIARYRNKAGAVVVAGAHMGNWEIGSLPTLAMGLNTAGVYRMVENPYVDRFLQRSRAPLYPGGLFAAKGEKGLDTVMKISTHLRSGGTLMMMADLVDWKGVPVPFFGHPMSATTAPAWLARRAGARLWAGRCMRLGRSSRFRMSFTELKVPRTDNPEDDIRVITLQLQRHFESWIREHPDQWMWSNKRWRDHELPGQTQD